MLIKNKERVHKYGEVYTPEWVVKKMCDMLEEENEDAFTALEKTWLEPSCGNGNFLVEIFRRKLLLCETPEDGYLALSTIYGIDILQDNIKESRERLKTMYKEKFGKSTDRIERILCRNIVCGNFLTKKDKVGNPIWFLEDESENENG